MIVHILEGYGAISALSTVAFLIWGWASGSPRRFAPRDDGSTRAHYACEPFIWKLEIAGEIRHLETHGRSDRSVTP